MLDGHALLSELAVAVFDSTSGAVEVYKGSRYPEGDDRHAAQQRANLLAVHYVPGHYRALVPAAAPAEESWGDGTAPSDAPEGQAPRVDQEQHTGPTLQELLRCLDAQDVFYVVTDG